MQLRTRTRRREQRPKTCTTCHRDIAPREWYWVEQRQRETSHISRAGKVRRGTESTYHFYCDDHEPLINL